MAVAQLDDLRPSAVLSSLSVLEEVVEGSGVGHRSRVA